jgi:hypothetical protein
MYDSQIGGAASQIASAIENNDFNSASQQLVADTQGMPRGFARALIDTTNQYLQQDSQRDNCQYDQIASAGLMNGYGLPVVDFVNGQNQPDASVALNVAEQYAPPPVYSAPPPVAYDGYNRPMGPAYAPPPEYPVPGPGDIVVPAIIGALTIGILAGHHHDR